MKRILLSLSILTTFSSIASSLDFENKIYGGTKVDGSVVIEKGYYIQANATYIESIKQYAVTRKVCKTDNKCFD